MDDYLKCIYRYLEENEFQWEAEKSEAYRECKREIGRKAIIRAVQAAAVGAVRCIKFGRNLQEFSTLHHAAAAEREKTTYQV